MCEEHRTLECLKRGRGVGEEYLSSQLCNSMDNFFSFNVSNTTLKKSLMIKFLASTVPFIMVTEAGAGV